MIHILACNEGGNLKCVGKMKFIDLVGYENTGRNSMDGTNFIEGTQINKSLNALLNVIHAINANETRVPYRESKLARVLQDSLGGNNHISMIVCLNPFFCPDTIHAINLASRLKIIKLVSVLSSSRKKHSNSRAPLSANKSNSGVAVSSTTKKQTNSRLPFSAKKTNVMLKGRNFFDGTEEANGIKEQVLSMENNPSDVVVVKSDLSNGGSNFVPFMKEEKCIGGALFSSDVKDIPSTILASSQEEFIFCACVPASDAKQEIVSLELKTKDVSVKTESNFTDFLHHVNGDNIDKENNHLHVNESQTPLLTARLIELRENLMCFATPLSVSRPHDPEPKTPIITQKLELSNCQSETFSKQNSRMKGIREKRASYILELREDSPEPFKSLDDLQEIGLSAKQGIEMLSLGSFTTGAILLAGLFFYDIFWVFFTPVMVSVAKSFDAPIKLLFPTRVAARPFSMLGLGDIVIPGIFVALALRFDVSRGRNSQYFKSAFSGYAVGVVLTIVVMNWFQAAQPALLYIVPAVIGFLAAHCIWNGEVKQLLEFDESKTASSSDGDAADENTKKVE